MIVLHRVSFRNIAAASVAALALMISGTAAHGQGGPQIMIMNDDGGGPSMSFFSMPDLMSLREPDFVKRDLPIFQEKLVLSEAQTSALERQIDAYLEAFDKLRKDTLTIPGMEPMKVAAAGQLKLAGANGEPVEIELGEGPMFFMGDEEFEDLEGGMGMDVGVRVEAPDGAVEAGDGAATTVAVTFQAKDADELPEEVRQALEKHAQEMAETIKAKIEQQIAEGKEPGQLPALPGIGPMHIEDMQKRQEDMAAQAKEFKKAKAELRQRFVADAQTALTPTQIERWPALERALLRDKSLPKGRLSGERTDLFKVLKGVDSGRHMTGDVSSQLDNYDLALDSALRTRNDYLEDIGQKVDKAMQEKNFDRALSLIDRATSLRVAVRSINEQYGEVIAHVLPEPAASEFREAMLRFAYPRIYKPSFAEKTFAAARSIEGLNERSATALKELEQAYRLDMNEANARIRRAIDKNEPDDPRRPIEHMKQMMASGGDGGGLAMLQHEEDPVHEAFIKRRELEDRYVKSVTSLLTPEQAEQLPKPPVKRKAGQPIIIHRSSSE